MELQQLVQLLLYQQVVVVEIQFMLQELTNDSNLQEIIKDAYKNRNKSSIKSDVFTYMYNKKLTEPQRMALNQLQRLCEIKLRKESWAAINAEEWQSAYDFFFPAIWESSTYSMNKILGNINSTVWQWFLNGWVSRTDFTPLSVNMVSNGGATNVVNIDPFSQWKKTSTNYSTNWAWSNNSSVASYSAGGYTITRP